MNEDTEEDCDDFISANISNSIMDDIVNQVFSLENDSLQEHQSSSTPAEDVRSQSTQESQDQEWQNDYFQPVSFYDDVNLDDSLNSLLDALPQDNLASLPPEFTDPGNNEQNKSSELVTDIIENVLDKVLDVGVVPRKIATVHPFTLTQTSSS